MKRITLIAALAAALAAAGSAQAASTERYCGAATNGLAVVASGPTSCGFAKATANTYLAQRHGTIRVYSRATHRSYTMRCRTVHTMDSPYLLCTGGIGSHVEVRS